MRAPVVDVSSRSLTARTILTTGLFSVVENLYYEEPWCLKSSGNSKGSKSSGKWKLKKASRKSVSKFYRGRATEWLMKGGGGFMSLPTSPSDYAKGLPRIVAKDESLKSIIQPSKEEVEPQKEGDSVHRQTPSEVLPENFFEDDYCFLPALHHARDLAPLPFMLKGESRRFLSHLAFSLLQDSYQLVNDSRSIILPKYLTDVKRLRQTLEVIYKIDKLDPDGVLKLQDYLKKFDTLETELEETFGFDSEEVKKIRKTIRDGILKNKKKGHIKTIERTIQELKYISNNLQKLKDNKDNNLESVRNILLLLRPDIEENKTAEERNIQTAACIEFGMTKIITIDEWNSYCHAYNLHHGKIPTSSSSSSSSSSSLLNCLSGKSRNYKDNVLLIDGLAYNSRHPHLLEITMDSILTGLSKNGDRFEEVIFDRQKYGLLPIFTRSCIFEMNEEKFPESSFQTGLKFLGSEVDQIEQQYWINFDKFVEDIRKKALLPDDRSIFCHHLKCRIVEDRLKDIEKQFGQKLELSIDYRQIFDDIESGKFMSKPLIHCPNEIDEDYALVEYGIENEIIKNYKFNESIIQSCLAKFQSFLREYGNDLYITSRIKILNDLVDKMEDSLTVFEKNAKGNLKDYLNIIKAVSPFLNTNNDPEIKSALDPISDKAP